MTAVLRLAVAAMLAATGTAVIPASATAQEFGIVQSDVLIIDPERLFAETRLGQNIAAQLQEERDKLIALNRRIEAELEAEEQELTALRQETAPEEFRSMADAFDARVQEIRRDNERRVRELERLRERAPVDFMRRIEPFLIEVMREAEAVVIMDARSVLLRAEVIDVTDIVAARIDAAHVDKPAAEPAEEPADQPEEGGTTEPAQ